MVKGASSGCHTETSQILAFKFVDGFFYRNDGNVPDIGVISPDF
jgi:hypothetical protein